MLPNHTYTTKPLVFVIVFLFVFKSRWTSPENPNHVAKLGSYVRGEGGGCKIVSSEQPSDRRIGRTIISSFSQSRSVRRFLWGILKVTIEIFKRIWIFKRECWKFQTRSICSNFGAFRGRNNLINHGLVKQRLALGYISGVKWPSNPTLLKPLSTHHLEHVVVHEPFFVFHGFYNVHLIFVWNCAAMDCVPWSILVEGRVPEILLIRIFFLVITVSLLRGVGEKPMFSSLYLARVGDKLHLHANEQTDCTRVAKALAICRIEKPWSPENRRKIGKK